MTPEHHLARFCALPEVIFRNIYSQRRGWFYIEAESVSEFRACTKCQTVSSSVYDHRYVKVLDSPIRDRRIQIRIKKKRYFCKQCKKPFTELLHGIYAHDRMTDRFRRSLWYFSSHFQNLVQVAKHHGCSRSSVERNLYPYLRRNVKRHLNYEWPKQIGIDEHSFGHVPRRYYGTDYNTVFVDIKAHRVYRVGDSKNARELFNQFKNLPGGENVEDVAMDMYEGFRTLCRALFPNARITADKFHVVRLLMPAINQRRKKIAGDRRRNPIGNLLLASKRNLAVSQRWMVYRFLEQHKELAKLYEFKERLHGLYRTKGYDRANLALENILEDLGHFPHIPELKRLRRTLGRWKTEILNYFLSGLTNGMTEGFNNKAKLVKKMAYGYRNRENFKLRYLNACFG